MRNILSHGLPDPNTPFQIPMRGNEFQTLFLASGEETVGFKSP